VAFEGEREEPPVEQKVRTEHLIAGFGEVPAALSSKLPDASSRRYSYPRSRKLGEKGLLETSSLDEEG